MKTPARRSKKGLRGNPEPQTVSRDELSRQYMALRKPGVCEKLEIKLLANIKKRLPELVKLFSDVEDHWRMEDGVYRYYHMSTMKARGRLIPMTQAMRSVFKSLLPGRPLCPLFETIYDEGLNPLPYPSNWSRKSDRDAIEAFFHAWYFLRMLIKYGKSLKSPDVLPSSPLKKSENFVT